MRIGSRISLGFKIGLNPKMESHVEGLGLVRSVR